MAYYVGDIPAEDLVIEPSRGEELLDLTPFTALDTEVVLRDFDGTIVPADFLVTFDLDPVDQVILEWPTTGSVFEAPGLYTLVVTLVGTDSRERLAPVYIVAQGDDGWHTVDSARAEWVDASPDDLRLHQVLELARQQVIAYAPTLATDAAIPPSYRHGQLMQARNLWNSSRVDPANGGAGDDSFVLRPFPLDWMVKQVLRPKSGTPVFG